MSFRRSFRRRKELEQIMGRVSGCRSGMTRSYMVYRCQKCHKEWRMYLETGLEEHGENHKPVPFMVRCSCGGMANDVSGIVRIPTTISIEEHMSYFANRADSDCGDPVLRGDIHGN